MLVKILYRAFDYDYDMLKYIENKEKHNALFYKVPRTG